MEPLYVVMCEDSPYMACTDPQKAERWRAWLAAWFDSLREARPDVWPLVKVEIKTCILVQGA